MAAWTLKKEQRCFEAKLKEAEAEGSDSIDGTYSQRPITVALGPISAIAACEYLTVA